MTTGINTSTTGVLFMKAEAAMVAKMNNPMAITGRACALSMTMPASASSTPVRTSAPETTNIAAIVIGAELEKTAMTSSLGTMPRRM